MLPQDQVVRLANNVFPKLRNHHLQNKNHNNQSIDDDDDDDKNNDNGGLLLLTSENIKVKQLCRLWAGMGHIYLVTIMLMGRQQQYKFVIKHVTPPPSNRQSFGDKRKAQSYQVESNFYENVATKILQHDGDDDNKNTCVLPVPFEVEHGPSSGEITICMSYLEGDGIDVYDPSQVRKTLKWLATFHSKYWGDGQVNDIVISYGLQKQGSYWHLDTRPDEHSSMSRRGWEGRLRKAARAIDLCMKRDPMQCLIHGDPKDANIMLLRCSNNNSNNEEEVAMYDFQYCGKGTPTTDLSYFLCSSCDDSEEDELVQYYYEQLVEQLSHQRNNDRDTTIIPPTIDHFKQSLELAYANYCRFMAGWGFWGFDIKCRVQKFLDELDGGKDLGSEEAYDEAIRKKLW